MGWCGRELLLLGLRALHILLFVVFVVVWVVLWGLCFAGVLRVCLDFWFSVLCCGAVGFGGGVGWVRVVFDCGGYWYLVCGL